MIVSILKQRTFLFKVMPLVVVVLITKFIIFRNGWELISLNPLFSGIVTANIFLLGFLLAGVLSDYKESEKLPGELAASLEAVTDECIILYKNKKDAKARECLGHIASLEATIRLWFYKKEKIKAVMDKIAGLSDFISHFEQNAHASAVARMKQEQSNIRRTMIRIQAIRDTSFVSAGYAIAEGVTFLLVVGLLFVKIDRIYEALFFTGTITFVLTYVVNMIYDLDNPFEYYEKKESGDEVSLKPLDDFEIRLAEKQKMLLK